MATALLLEDGTPPMLDDAGRWRPPVPLAPDVLTPEVLDAGPDLARDSAQVLLVDTDEAVYAQGDRCPGAVATALVDPRTALAGRPLGERGGLLVELRRAGWTRSTPVLLPPAVLAGVGDPPPTADGRLLRVERDAQGGLVLVRGPAAGPAAPPA